MDADQEQLDKEQRLKAAMYYTIKQIAKEVEEEMEVSVSAQVLATVSESLNRQVECYATDLENFAKHARRTTVNDDDVKLLARRNNTLLQHLNSIVDEQAAQKEASKKPKKSKGKGKRGQREDAEEDGDA